MKRTEKEAIISEVNKKALKATALYFADFSGISVTQETDLRREFRKSGIEYRVVKNTLARKALENVEGCDHVADQLVGPTGIAFGYDDAVMPAKIIKKFFEKTGKLTLKAAVVERQMFVGAKLEELAKLPSRKELIAGILGSIQSPVSGVVGAVNAVLRDLVSVIDQIGKKKQAA
ncbi:MAG: 50S ribosomal protein L10 [Bacteroidota bacterium]